MSDTPAPPLAPDKKPDNAPRANRITVAIIVTAVMLLFAGVRAIWTPGHH